VPPSPISVPQSDISTGGGGGGDTSFAIVESDSEIFDPSTSITGTTSPLLQSSSDYHDDLPKVEPTPASEGVASLAKGSGSGGGGGSDSVIVIDDNDDNTLVNGRCSIDYFKKKFPNEATKPDNLLECLQKDMDKSTQQFNSYSSHCSKVVLLVGACGNRKQVISNVRAGADTSIHGYSPTMRKVQNMVNILNNKNIITLCCNVFNLEINGGADNQPAVLQDFLEYRLEHEPHQQYLCKLLKHLIDLADKKN